MVYKYAALDVSYEKRINDYPHFELQNANEFHALFKIPRSHLAIPLRAQGLPLLMICLLKPGTWLLVVNFPVHWLLIVRADTLLSGWDGTGKSIALCWLITDFPTDQNALIDDRSCRVSLSTLPAPVMDALATHHSSSSCIRCMLLFVQNGSSIPHSEQEGWAMPQISLSSMRACPVCIAPPLLSTRWCCRPMF